eukprot:6696592-Prorocentrum_lima.AAC.1
MADPNDPECRENLRKRALKGSGPEAVLKRWKGSESKQVLPNVKEEDYSVFADSKGRIFRRISPQYGAPMTGQVFTSLQNIDRRTDICRVSPMAYQERVGPL